MAKKKPVAKKRSPKKASSTKEPEKEGTVVFIAQREATGTQREIKDPLLPADHPLREELELLAGKAMVRGWQKGDVRSLELGHRLHELLWIEWTGGAQPYGKTPDMARDLHRKVESSLAYYMGRQPQDREHIADPTEMAKSFINLLRFSPIRLENVETPTERELGAALSGTDDAAAQHYLDCVERVQTAIEPLLRPGRTKRALGRKLLRKALLALNMEQSRVREILQYV